MYVTNPKVNPDVHNTLRRTILDEVQQELTTTVDLPYCGQESHTQEVFKPCGETLPINVRQYRGNYILYLIYSFRRNLK